MKITLIKKKKKKNKKYVKKGLKQVTPKNKENNVVAVLTKEFSVEVMV